MSAQKIISLVRALKPNSVFSWISILFFMACIAFALFQLQRSAPQMTLVQGLQQCARNTNGDIQLIACSRELVSTQLQAHSAAALMDEIATSSIPSQFGGCHGVAHLIGEETYDKYHSVEKAFNECSQSCYGGCLHGIVAGAVKAEFGASDPGVDIAHMDVGQIEKIGAKYCASTALCHGIGHILYYVAADFEKAAKACDPISSGFPHEMCVSGIFMQGVGDIHDSLAMSNASMPQPASANGDYAYPCDTVSPQYQHQCFLFLPLYQLNSFKAADVSAIAAKSKIAKDTCERQVGAARSYCFEGMGYNAFTFSNVKDGDYVNPVVSMCTSLPDISDQESCALGFVTISRGYGYDRQAYSFCAALPSELQTVCYFTNFAFLAAKMTPAEGTYCQYASAKDACAAAYSAYQSQRATLPDYRFGLYGKAQ